MIGLNRFTAIARVHRNEMRAPAREREPHENRVLELDGLSRLCWRAPRIRVMTFHTHSHSSAWIDLRRLLTDFPRVNDEFERIRVLIFLHQLQICEPLSASYRIATGKLRLRGFD